MYSYSRIGLVPDTSLTGATSTRDRKANSAKIARRGTGERRERSLRRRISSLRLRHRRRQLDRLDDATELVLRVEIGVGAVAAHAEPMTALEQRVSLGRHRLDLGLDVLHVVPQVVQSLAPLGQKLLVGVRSLDGLDQLIHRRAHERERELHHIGPPLSSKCHRVHAMWAVGIDVPWADAELLGV